MGCLLSPLFSSSTSSIYSPIMPCLGIWWLFPMPIPCLWRCMPAAHFARVIDCARMRTAFCARIFLFFAILYLASNMPTLFFSCCSPFCLYVCVPNLHLSHACMSSLPMPSSSLPCLVLCLLCPIICACLPASLLLCVHAITMPAALSLLMPWWSLLMLYSGKTP